MPRILATPGTIGYYPILKVDVVVGKGQRRQQLTAVLDSGADRTVVPRSIVEALGVKYDQLKEPVDADGDVNRTSRDHASPRPDQHSRFKLTYYRR